MKSKLFSVLSLIGVGLIFASISGIPPALATESAKKEEALTVTAKAYTAEESKIYLHRDLPSRAIQPIEITIQNNTSDTYLLPPKPTNLPSVSASDVAWKVSKSAIPRSIGYKIASLFFWPFAIAGTVDSIRTFKKHRDMKKNFQIKQIKDEKVLPYSVLNRILFVKTEDYQDSFQIRLIDDRTDKNITLDVQASP